MKKNFFHLSSNGFLGQIKGIDDVEPMTFPIKSHQVIMREDEPSTPLPAEEALKIQTIDLETKLKFQRWWANVILRFNN